MDASLLWQIGGTLCIAGAAYGAIRADLKGLHDSSARNEARTDKLEDRFNNHIEQGLTHGNPQA
jgi:hypothetical protein